MYSIQKFLSKIKITSSGCWEWGKPNHNKGYGVLCYKYKRMYIHRFIYDYFYGNLKPNLQIDHLCRNRLCVNPKHLEQVTHKTNTLRGFSFSAINSRKTHCPKGHPYSGDNLCFDYRGTRRCKKCRSENNRRSYNIIN